MMNYCTDIEYNAKGNILFLRKEIGERNVPASRIRRQGNVAVVKPAQGVVASMAEAFSNEIQPLLRDCPDSDIGHQGSAGHEVHFLAQGCALTA